MTIDASALDPFEWARRLHEWGSEDPGFDLLMVLGPLVVLVLVLAGRNIFTTILAGAYVAAFIVILAWNALAESQ